MILRRSHGYMEIDHQSVLRLGVGSLQHELGDLLSHHFVSKISWCQHPPTDLKKSLNVSLVA